MKISKTQQMVLDLAKKEIDTARKLDYPEWLVHERPCYAQESEYWKNAFENAIKRGEFKDYWENARKSIVLTWCNSRTIKALEELGLIEIIVDGGIHPDTVRVLNY
ncbi:MAG: hypothetical protein J6S12_02035 [Alphaproteobacteria bacterium]|nr:hypothetical protein [Alphaproteobacteria bacterium]